MQDLPAQPPEPWTLTESPGDSQLLLTRQYNDETIEVRVIADEVRCRGFEVSAQVYRLLTSVLRFLDAHTCRQPTNSKQQKLVLATCGHMHCC
jgi:hypothetical protein